jgi:hypothetical protein
MAGKAEQVQALADVVALAAIEVDQFYEAYLSFTSILRISIREICVALAEGFPEILSMPPDLVDTSQWISACESLAIQLLLLEAQVRPICAIASLQQALRSPLLWRRDRVSRVLMHVQSPRCFFLRKCQRRHWLS